MKLYACFNKFLTSLRLVSYHTAVSDVRDLILDGLNFIPYKLLAIFKRTHQEFSGAELLMGNLVQVAKVVAGSNGHALKGPYYDEATLAVMSAQSFV